MRPDILTLPRAVVVAKAEGYTITQSGLRQACADGRLDAQKLDPDGVTSPWLVTRAALIEWLEDESAHRTGKPPAETPAEEDESE